MQNNRLIDFTIEYLNSGRSAQCSWTYSEYSRDLLLPFKFENGYSMFERIDMLVAVFSFAACHMRVLKAFIEG